MDTSINKIKVKIGGEEYIVKGDASEEYILKLANFVDSKISEISKKNIRLSKEKAAVLAALNIADELHKIREEYAELESLLK